MNKTISTLREHERHLMNTTRQAINKSDQLPKYFFVTKGTGISDVSPLNAFDAALVDARIGQCNLVYLSSILPSDAELIDPIQIVPGTITFCVMARMDGDPGETIGAGIGCLLGKHKNQEGYGLVAEAHGYKDKEAIDRELKRALREMAEIRKLGVETPIIESLSLETPKGKYGTTLAALIYAPWTSEDSRRELRY
jgi:arginine decarboxylase